MKGRKKVPTKIKEIKGTIRKVREFEHPLIVEVQNQVPPPPDYLNELAVPVWYKVCDWMIRYELLNEIDLQLVAMYCVECGVYEEAALYMKQRGANSLIDTTSNGNEIQHAWRGIMNTALKNAQNLASEFGFTPSARARMGVGSMKVKNKFEEL